MLRGLLGVALPLGGAFLLLLVSLLLARLDLLAVGRRLCGAAGGALFLGLVSCSGSSLGRGLSLLLLQLLFARLFLLVGERGNVEC